MTILDENIDSKTRKKLEDAIRAREQEEALREFLARALENAAYERLMNVRIANQELYTKVANAVVYLYQKAGRRITEKELISLLSHLTSRREGEISIRRK